MEHHVTLSFSVEASPMFREFMDLEREVCADSSSSLVFVPYKENFTPGSLHTCSKFSGKVPVQH